MVTLCCLATALSAPVLFDFVQYRLGIDDSRGHQVSVWFAVLVGIVWLVSLVNLTRRPLRSVEGLSSQLSL